ncbi:PREDICTED: uncharacterized protein LOC106819310 [Priapulus caudatus]|uniref:Uncharacterized protein LOC106819310 n=1 Tax=Priapulus caudatus TaxID=37621 RepID=A0ABM1F4S1_PRICU|nr:PREDICTED: uncharacterized protein LOC106819310 [Priapulus caudatus]
MFSDNDGRTVSARTYTCTTAVSEPFSSEGDQCCHLGSSVFPDLDSDDGLFHTEVLFAVQRYFSLHGLASGPHPLNIPDTLISDILPKLASQVIGRSRMVSGIVFDVVTHLCGRAVPGLQVKGVSGPQTPAEVSQLVLQYAALLKFLSHYNESEDADDAEEELSDHCSESAASTSLPGAYPR